MTAESRALTSEEVRARFLNHICVMVRYWQTIDTPTVDRVEGLAHSILAAIDGCTLASPNLKLVAYPHPNDKDYHKGVGENWIEPGTILNEDVMLHECYSNLQARYRSLQAQEL